MEQQQNFGRVICQYTQPNDRIAATQPLYEVRSEYKDLVPCKTVQCLAKSQNCFLPDSLQIIVHSTFLISGDITHAVDTQP